MADLDVSASINPALASVQAETSQVRIDANQSALSGSGGSDAATATIASLDDFKKKFPELYKAMMDSMAQEMMRQSQRASDRVVQKLREQRYSS